MAKAKKKQVYVFEIEVMEPDPEFGEDEEFNFFVPESLGKIHGILTSLRDASEMCAIRGGAWLFCTGVVVFAVMTGAMAAAGADPSLWYDEAILTAFLFLVSANLLLQRRK